MAIYRPNNRSPTSSEQTASAAVNEIYESRDSSYMRMRVYVYEYLFIPIFTDICKLEKYPTVKCGIKFSHRLGFPTTSLLHIRLPESTHVLQPSISISLWGYVRDLQIDCGGGGTLVVYF